MSKDAQKIQQRPATPTVAAAPAPAPTVIRLAKIDVETLKKLAMPDLIALARREGLYSSSFRTSERLITLLVDAKLGGTGKKWVHGHMRCELCRERVDQKSTTRTSDGSLLIRSVRCRGERHHTYQIVEDAPKIDTQE